MGATVITNIRVFKHPQIQGKEIKSGLFEDEDLLIVLENTYEKNCHPHAPSWSLAFIGTSESLQNEYWSTTKENLDDGVTQLKGVTRSQIMAKLSADKAKIRQFTASSLNTMGIKCFSISEEHFNIQSNKTAFEIIEFFKDWRYQIKITTDSDITNLISAYLDYHQAHETPLPYWQAMPWISTYYKEGMQVDPPL